MQCHCIAPVQTAFNFRCIGLGFWHNEIYISLTHTAGNPVRKGFWLETDGHLDDNSTPELWSQSQTLWGASVPSRLGDCPLGDLIRAVGENTYHTCKALSCENTHHRSRVLWWPCLPRENWCSSVPSHQHPFPFCSSKLMAMNCFLACFYCERDRAPRRQGLCLFT